MRFDDENNPMVAWVNLIHASTHLREGLDTEMQAQLGISLAEQDFLKQINANDGALKLSELARRIYFSKAGITKMLDRLEAQGLLTREPMPEDRRAMRAVLTDKGRSTVARSREVLSQYLEENFRAHLSDRNVRQLNYALKELLTGLGAWDGQLAQLEGAATD